MEVSVEELKHVTLSLSSLCMLGTVVSSNFPVWVTRLCPQTRKATAYFPSSSSCSGIQCNGGALTSTAGFTLLVTTRVHNTSTRVRRPYYYYWCETTTVQCRLLDDAAKSSVLASHLSCASGLSWCARKRRCAVLSGSACAAISAPSSRCSTRQQRQLSATGTHQVDFDRPRRVD